MNRTLLLLMLGFTGVASAQVDLDRRVTLHIAGDTPLDKALVQFGSQTGIQIMLASDSVDTKTKVANVAGTYVARVALSDLLHDSGLTYTVARNTVIVSVSDRTVPVIASDRPLAPQSSDRPSSSEPKPADNGVTSESGNQADSQSGSQKIDGSQHQRSNMTEIIISAQKRDERLQDVPVPVTALSGQDLVESHQLRLQDYFSNVPGLSLASSGSGDLKLALRGVTTGTSYSNPTVGIMVDDAPYGSTTVLGGFRTSAPDIDPSDLQRVEVLRGPQGTLYGASSIGGLVKFVTIDPSTDTLKGRVQADVLGVSHGDGAGYGGRAAANIPISDSFAVRMSGFARRDPGYLDDPVRHVDGVNKTDVYGGRVSALWHIAENWSLKLSALLQNIQADGTSDATVRAGVGDLQQIRTLQNLGGYDRDTRSYTATLKGTFGGVNLTSVSGYSIDKYHLISDLSAAFGGFATDVFGVGGAVFSERDKTSKFTQEVRLAGSFQQRLDWLAGFFYTHESSPNRAMFLALDPDHNNALAGILGDDPYPTTYTEYAVFGDLTLHVTDRFDVQVGGRESQNKQHYEETLSGPFYGDLSNPPISTKDNSFTYLVTPSYKFSPDLMTYARFASGYRPGGPNSTCTVFNVPCKYGPDKTRNYELGVKGNALGHLLTFDASVYYIDWNDIQISVVDPVSGLAYFTNASKARSQGLELSLQSHPIQGLTLGAWVDWNDATLRSSLPAASQATGASGDRLPASSRFSGNLSVDEELPVSANVIAFLGANLNYVGDRKGDFAIAALADLPRLDLPSYVQLNARGGARIDTWTVSLFVNNALDRRGVLSAAYDQVPLPGNLAVNYIQPRTVGLSAVKEF